MNENNQI